MANFTDDFTGTSGDNLEDRTGWSLTDGPAGAAEINASNQLKYSTTSSAGYQAPAASNSNHFAQAVRRYEPVGSTWFFPWCICFADSSNFIGLRFIDAAGDKQEVWKAIGGSFTKLASASDGGGAGTL